VPLLWLVEVDVLLCHVRCLFFHGLDGLPEYIIAGFAPFIEGSQSLAPLDPG
jgi:hypothetical protein